MAKVEDKVLTGSKAEAKDLSQSQVLPDSQAVLKENQEKLKGDLVGAKLVELAKYLANLKEEGKTQEVAKLETALEEGITKFLALAKERGEDLAPEVVRENLAKLGEEHVEQEKVVTQLKALAEKNLSREELVKELAKIPDLNKEEALKVVAQFELEREAEYYKDSLAIVANKREGEDALKLDLTLSLNTPVPGESEKNQAQRESLLRVSDERKKQLLAKYPDILTREGIDAVSTEKSREGLIDLYLAKTKGVPWEERRWELVRAGIFGKQEIATGTASPRNDMVGDEASATTGPATQSVIARVGPSGLPVAISSVTPAEHSFRENLMKKEL